MAILSHVPSGAQHVLQNPHRVGRSRSSQLRLQEAGISGEHALFRWTDKWTLRDLGSSNGTWVNGTMVQPGVSHALSVGDQIGWGVPEASWRIESLSPPSASAHHGATIVEGDGALLALPSEEEALWAAHLASDEEGWYGPEGPIFDGDVVNVQGTAWTLRIPELLASTQHLTDPRRDLHDVAVAFEVSPDEEYVEVTITVATTAHPLKPRAHHYLLLTLARARQSDRETGVEELEAGWRSYDELCRMVRLERSHLYVAVHRLRKEVAKLGVAEGDRIVERRKVTNQLRIGVGDFAIRRRHA